MADGRGEKIHQKLEGGLKGNIMSDAKIIQAAKEFAEFWENKGYEKGESQPFWLSLLRDVLGVEHPEQFIEFEDQVHLDHTSFIDGMIPSTHVLIEQKGFGKDLNAPIKQSDGTLLSPFQQAKRYAAELPYSQRPRYIVTCNFAEFYIYDMENPQGEPEKLLLKDLPKEYYRLKFLTDTGDVHIQKEMEISVKAGALVGKLYDALIQKYLEKPTPSASPVGGREPRSGEGGLTEHLAQSLNILCVRLVFCLYAEDAGVFNRLQFHDYLASFNKENVRTALIDLFKTLNTKIKDRDPYMSEKLAAFPYVNGGLFAEENIIIPQLDESIVDILLNDCSVGFDWSEISPTIFGAVFESTLNPETRRKGGMHYTSIENIHKVIDPLFLDDLKDEFAKIKEMPNNKKRQTALVDFQNKLASLKFLDPACGSGNFLTETYICLRKIENEIISLLHLGECVLVAEENPIRVSISQFYGIEINDFAVTVSMTALWIAESQMMKATEGIVHMDLNFLPLKTNAYIVEGNALRMDWNKIIPANEVNYIMGNPPFVGGMMMNEEQKNDMWSVFGQIKGVGEMDYVCAWYKKAVDYIQHTNIRIAFVSTNSICQGQQAVTLWKPLSEKGVVIQFAHRSFIWDSESSLIAHVHVVIVGFSLFNTTKNKIIFSKNHLKYAQNINSYLVDANNVFIESKSTPLCNVSPMLFGSMPRDGGGFIVSEEEYKNLKDDIAKKYIKEYLGAEEFINAKKRYCLWLVDAKPQEIRNSTFIMERVEKVREFRASSKAAATRKFAETPTLFCQIAQPVSGRYIIVPRVSSERRRYVPMGFLDSSIIASDAVQIIPNATMYEFGVLTSNVHMAWMRAVAGRLKSDYRYSKDIVYNNFPWPTHPGSASHPSLMEGQKRPHKGEEGHEVAKGVIAEQFAKQKAKIEETAQAILDARAKYSDSSWADLYDELTMPADLRKAHQANDKAVMEAYGFDYRTMTESECVAELMKMYQELVGE
ncbi:MAG: N-6 DNA methylase [Acidaminococcaceae bacterium]|nr:N-6 DNA methylase [Acidaminococcaceae bacterium]